MSATEPDPYLAALSSTLRAEELHSEESGFALLASEFPGVELSAKYIEVPSGPGITQYKAVWRGATLTGWSLVGLRGQLLEVQVMLGPAPEPEAS